jgi:hypothetical protein
MATFLHFFLPAIAGFLLALFFNPEDGGGMFLQNTGFCLNYMASQSRSKSFTK